MAATNNTAPVANLKFGVCVFHHFFNIIILSRTAHPAMDSAGKTLYTKNGQPSLNKEHCLGFLASQDIGTMLHTSPYLQRGRDFH